MCNICTAFRPLDKDCAYQDLNSSSHEISHAPADRVTGRAQADLPEYSYQQIAQVLTTDYWENLGQTARSFRVPSEGLSVDLSGLTRDGAKLAELALEAWSDVSGINFYQIELPNLLRQFEGGDGGDSLVGATELQINATLSGALTTRDEDYYAVELTAGKTYTINLDGNTDGRNALADPYLRLLNTSGREVDSNDDAVGLDSQLTFVARQSGTYYLQADRYDPSMTGDYKLSIREGKAAQIRFDDEESGGYSTSVLNGRQITSSFVNIDKSLLWGDKAIGGYAFQTYMHEIGHALGLGHAGFYNGSAEFPLDASYANDSWQSSVMSYFDQGEVPGLDADFARIATLMPGDIRAIQSLYGNRVDSRDGDTIYGVDSNAGGYLGQLLRQVTGSQNRDGSTYNGGPIAVTLFDSGGTDLIDVSLFSGDQRINLKEEESSDVLGLRGSLLIAANTRIENATAGRGHDTIIGNRFDNRLEGNAGDDLITGGRGNDTLLGGRGADALEGGHGNDALYGGNGDDGLFGDHGVDRLEGGQGNDMLYGGSGNDMILGGDGADYAEGEGGNDKIWGNTGSDTLDGGSGNDVLFGGNDDDMIFGGANSDRLFGEFGSDRLFGDSGNDTAYGGDGADEIDGGSGNDRLYGESGRDVINGGSGNDFLSGGYATDFLYGDVGNDELWGNKGGDQLFGGSGNDDVNGGDGDDMLSGDTGHDTLFGGHGNDVIIGGANNDTLTGGLGVDTFVFEGRFGRDIITDYDENYDILEIDRNSFSGNSSDLLDRFGQDRGDSYVIDFRNGAAITLEGEFQTSQLENDIVFI